MLIFIIEKIDNGCRLVSRAVDATRTEMRTSELPSRAILYRPLDRAMHVRTVAAMMVFIFTETTDFFTATAASVISLMKTVFYNDTEEGRRCDSVGFG